MINSEHPRRLHLDGMYFRVERDGEWRNINLTDLTDEEIHATLANADKAFIINTLTQLVETIRTIATTFGIQGTGDDDE